MDFESYLLYIANKIGLRFTDEQAEFIRNFNKSMISFSLPGTGKTATSTCGLIMAEKFHGINATKIWATSFSRNATAELKIRHEQYCKELSMRPKVHFQTIHSICRTLLLKHHEKIGMYAINIVDNPAFAQALSAVEDTAESLSITLKYGQARKILNAIRYCNSAFIFDTVNLESRYAFRQCGIAVTDFQRIRYQLYELNKAACCIPIGDLPLYALELLITAPEVGAAFRKDCELFLIDEFQDLSLLQLSIVKHLSDKVIAIGDINQQIYGFQGACGEIVQRYMEYYPDAIEINLTQSFRCSESVAAFSAEVIRPNGTNGSDLKGTGKTGIFTIDEAPVSSIVEDIAREYARVGRFEKTTMFLFRNNFSAIAVSDSLFEHNIPYRVDDYVPMNQRPIISDMVEMALLLLNPDNSGRIGILRKFVPEFMHYRGTTDKMPLYKVMDETALPFYEVPLRLKDPAVTTAVYDRLRVAQQMLFDGAPFASVVDVIFPVYYDNYFGRIKEKVDYDSTMIMLSFGVVVKQLPFRAFMARERQKADLVEENNSRRIGIRCLTFHGSKGLEADIVHILDADKGIVPSKKQLNNMHELGCNLDIGRELRNERCLCYVAATRAKTELHIHYTQELTPIYCLDENPYQRYDDIYASSITPYIDHDVFSRFIKGA